MYQKYVLDVSLLTHFSISYRQTSLEQFPIYFSYLGKLRERAMHIPRTYKFINNPSFLIFIMKVMLVYPNDRMDGLIPVGTSVLSSHLKAAGHEVRLYDTTFVDTGKETGDFYREALGQVIPVDLSRYGLTREKMSLNDPIS